MKFENLFSVWISVLAIFIAVCGCAGGKTDSLNEADQLFALERLAISKEFQNDTAFLSSIMDSTFIELAKGKIKNKHEVLQTIYEDNLTRQQNQVKRDSFLLKDSIVHFYGNTAVVTFIMQTFNKKGDSAFIRRTRFYDLWVKRDNKWKAIAWQGSPVE